MKINLNGINRESFNIKDGEINGHKVFLVTPQDFNCEWNKDNLHLRSVIIDTEGNILSRGFSKFFNAFEKPNLYPNIENYNDLIWEEKLDGSLAICDDIFNQFSCHTRGTVSYKTLENAADFDFCFNKYPKIKDICRANPDDSFLFEIVSPNRRIILSYSNEPDLYFLGFIHKPTGLYYPSYSNEGKFIHFQIGCKLPKIYDLKGSFTDIVSEIKKWEKLEGCIVKYNNSQTFIKAKSLWYLARHSLKSQLNTFNKIVDLFFELNCPDFLSFYKNIEETIDFETAEEIKPKLIQICDSYLHVLREIYELRQIVIDNELLDQKCFARLALTNYKESSNILFSLRKFNKLNKEQVRKMLERELNGQQS